MMKVFIDLFITKLYSVNHVKEDDTNGASRTHGRDKKLI